MILTIDFETYWDQDYTLSKMSTEEYVRDPRFKAHMVGIKNGDGKTVVVPEHLIPKVFARIDWSQTMVLCQHTHFDGFILSHRYGVVPKFLLDTLSMFRAIYPSESASLANQTKVLGLPAKGNGYDIVNTKGIRTLNPTDYQKCASYCALDCDLTKQIFDLLKPHFPISEVRLIDLTIRMFTDPVLELDEPLLQEAYDDELAAKAALLERVAHDKDALSSNPKFAQILLDLGVDPPKKLSPAKVKRGEINPETEGEAPVGLLNTETKKVWAYAFGKSDEAFKRLLEHENPMVQAIMEARFGVKSTIKETRAQRFIGIAQRGTFPIYLKYYGAHTGRYGGGDKVNPQNLNKFCPNPECGGGKVGEAECPKCEGSGVSPLRRAIMAPEGYVIVVRDLSAIEARVNAWLAGQEDMVDIFRRGEDIYCDMYQTISGRAITKKDKNERFLGKTIVLGCGYGLGWRKFQGMLRVGMLGDKGRLLGWDIADGLGVNVDGFKHKLIGYIRESLPPGVSEDVHALHCACAQKIIQTFRDNKPKIPEMWDTCQKALSWVLEGKRERFGTGGIIETRPEGLVLPNKMIIRYTELEAKQIGRRVEYSVLKNKRKGEREKLYGGKVDENLVQALSRIILTDAMLQMHREGIRVVHQVHDEILAVCRESEAEKVYHRMGTIMSAPPTWAPDLPLASEGGWNRRYIK